MATIDRVSMTLPTMVIVPGFVGGDGRGFGGLQAPTRCSSGLEIRVRSSLVPMAEILDRTTETCGQRLQPPGGQ